MGSTRDNRHNKLVEQEEEDMLSRNLLIWLNTCPNIPETVDIVNYEMLRDDVPGMALSTIQAAFLLEKYIIGGYKAEYQFKLIYRLKPGPSMDKRLKADETLDRMGAWVSRNWNELKIGDGLRVISAEPTTRSSIFGMYENGDEDHQILMKITYERMN